MIATEQMPGVYRRMVGEVLVTALSDGHIVFPPGILQIVSPAEAEALMRAAGRRPPFATVINAFLLQWPTRTVLVDTGAGATMGPTCGRLMHNLQAAGVSPADIDAVLLTHLHGDHTGGLVDAGDSPVFRNAELLVPETEMAFWLNDEHMAAAPEARRPGFLRARQVTAAYGDRLRRFDGQEPLPGIEAVALPGHTPGHTGYAVGTGGERLLIWADILHVQEVQSARPDVTLPFDTDPALAAKTRRDILDRAATEDLLVTGMHLNFPGFARVARAGSGYTMQPEVWQGALSLA